MSGHFLNSSMLRDLLTVKVIRLILLGCLDVVCSLAKHFYMWHQSSFLEQFAVAREGSPSDLSGLFKCCLQPCQMFICFLYKSSFLEQVDVARPSNSKGNPSDLSGLFGCCLQPCQTFLYVA